MNIFKKKTTNYVNWNTYKRKIDFLSEFYFEQAQIHNQTKAHA